VHPESNSQFTYTVVKVHTTYRESSVSSNIEHISDGFGKIYKGLEIAQFIQQTIAILMHV